MKRYSTPLSYKQSDINRFLDEIKLNSNNNNPSTAVITDSPLKWIPFNEFSNIKEIGKGGFGVVYEAIWHDAPEQKFDLIWNKKRVALKVLRNSNKDDQSTDFLNELRLHYRCMDSGRVLPCYGISQEPQTNSYILVMQYASEGNLRKYLSTSFARFDWWKKINMLRDIVIGLQSIHNAGLVHHDFHSGNILRHGYGNDSNNLDTYISDLGLCHPIHKSDKNDKNDKNYTKSKVFGVLPYLAPEVLRGEQYTKAADVYSLGIIMWEVTTGDKPFYDRSHDYQLAVEICSGLRPKIMTGTPECYAQVMQKCWNADPLLRPTVEELYNTFKQFKEISNYRTQIGEAELLRFGIIENITSKNASSKSTHPQAIYTSRLFEFSNLPQPKNADPETTSSQITHRPVHPQLLHLASASDFGQLAARRRANSVTSHNRRPNKQTNRRSVQVQNVNVSNTFNERRRSRSFNSEEVAEGMRQLSLSLRSKDLNAINEELFEE